MSSLFDSEVYARRKYTPFARIDAEEMLKSFALEVGADALVNDHEPRLTVRYRPDVASRFWWTLRWYTEDGEVHVADGQTLELCLWRAATHEAHKLEKERQRQKGIGNDEIRT